MVRYTTAVSKWRSRRTAHSPRPVDSIGFASAQKWGAPLHLKRGDELKLVFPQLDGAPEQYEQMDFTHFYLQPMDGPAAAENTQLAMSYCLDQPRWRLSVQTHKVLGIR